MPSGRRTPSPSAASPSQSRSRRFSRLGRQRPRPVRLVVEPVRDGRLQGSARGEGQPLRGRQDRPHQLGRARRPADLPAGDAVALAGARQGQRPLEHARQRGERHVLVVVEGEVLVHLVGDHDEVVLDRHVGDRLQLLAGEHGAGRVVGRVEQHEPGTRADGRPELVGVEPEVGRTQGDRPPYATGHLDHRDVGVVVGLEHDDLVARVHRGPAGRLRSLPCSRWSPPRRGRGRARARSAAAGAARSPVAGRRRRCPARTGWRLRRWPRARPPARSRARRRPGSPGRG